MTKLTSVVIAAGVAVFLLKPSAWSLRTDGDASETDMTSIETQYSQMRSRLAEAEKERMLASRKPTPDQEKAIREALAAGGRVRRGQPGQELMATTDLRIEVGARRYITDFLQIINWYAAIHNENKSKSENILCHGLLHVYREKIFGGREVYEPYRNIDCDRN